LPVDGCSASAFVGLRSTPFLTVATDGFADLNLLMHKS
jgi:hypothetical protein